MSVLHLLPAASNANFKWSVRAGLTAERSSGVHVWCGDKIPTGRRKALGLSLSAIHCHTPSSMKDPASMSYFVLKGIKSTFVFKGETKPETPHLSFSKRGVLERSVSCITELTE